VVPPTVMLVMLLRHVALSAKVTTKAPSTVAVALAVRVGGVPLETLPETVRFCWVAPPPVMAMVSEL